MNHLAAACFAALLLTATAPAAPAQTPPTATAQAENPALASILADYEAYLRALDPITAGQEGDQAAKSRLPDPTRAFEEAQVQPLTAFKTRLAAIDTASLSPDDALNHAFLTRIVDRSIEAIAYDSSRLAFDSEGGPGQSAAYLASVTRIANRADADAWLARLGGIAAFYDAALENARRGLESGFVQPRSVVESALVTFRNEAAFTPQTDPLLKPFTALPGSIPAEAQAELRARAAAIVTEQIAPRRQAWVAFVEGDYLPAAPETVGVGTLPGVRSVVV